MTHVCIHVVCIPMVVVVVLALLLKDIGGLRLCVGNKPGRIVRNPNIRW